MRTHADKPTCDEPHRRLQQSGLNNKYKTKTITLKPEAPFYKLAFLHNKKRKKRTQRKESKKKKKRINKID